MDKTGKQVTINPKRQKAAWNDKKKYMNKLKGSVLNEATIGSNKDNINASNDAADANTSATTCATNAITRSRDTYIYCVGIAAVLAIDVCVFFAD